MRCKTCEYQLWNLRERRCPECGTPFLPSEHELVPQTVEFCCPHCDQPYYGTDPKGHLDPPAFRCVRCGRDIQMDEMVLRPAPGVDDEQTRPKPIPWLDRKRRGTVRSWLATVWIALVHPLKLGHELHRTHGVGWWFAFFTQLIVSSAAVGIVSLLPLALTFRRLGPPILGFCGGVALVAVALAVAVFILLLIWGGSIHGLLRLTGPTAGGARRTYQALCYSSGANVASAVPFCGFYFGWIWWVVSTLLTVKEAQRVSARRAVLAVLPFPLLSLAGLVTLYVWFVAYSLTVSGSGGGFAGMSAQMMARMLKSHAWQNSAPPQHAAQLVAMGTVPPEMFRLRGSTWDPQQATIGGVTVQRLASLPANEAAAVAQAAADALPPNVVAHRLGDFVFTYHGIDFNAGDPNLWLVIASPDPVANGPTPTWTTISAATLGGSAVTLPRDQFAAQLDQQSTLRNSHNLPPLPDPDTVTETQPAVAPP